jgi:hypothetical protein
MKHRLERNWERGMDEQLRGLHKTYSRGDTFIVIGFGVLLLALLAMLGILIWG